MSAYIRRQPFVFDDLQRFDGDGTSQRIAAKSAAVFAGSNAQHHVVVGEDGAHRTHAARQRFSQQQHVGTNAFVVARQPPAGAPKARLDFVGDEQHVESAANGSTLLQKAHRRHDHAAK